MVCKGRVLLLLERHYCQISLTVTVVLIQDTIIPLCMSEFIPCIKADNTHLACYSYAYQHTSILYMLCCKLVINYLCLSAI